MESWTKSRLQTQSDKTNNTELAVLFVFLLNTQSIHTVQAGKSNLYANVSSNVRLESCVAIRRLGVWVVKVSLPMTNGLQRMVIEVCF